MNIFSESIGNGPVILWTHGWTMSSRFFQKQSELSKRFRLIFWDLPGHGRSEKKGKYSVSDCAKALHELLKKLGENRIIALGWSLGAVVLWEYLRLYGAEPFQKVINVESVPWGEPERYEVPAVEFSFKHSREKAQEKFIRKMFFQKPNKQTIQWMLQEALKTPTEAALSLYREVADCNYLKVAANCPIPILTIMSRHGFHLDQMAKLQSSLPKHPILLFDQSGHMPFWEEPKTFHQVLDKYCL